MPQIDWALMPRLSIALTDAVSDVVEGFNGPEYVDSEILEGDTSKEDVQKFILEVTAQFKKIQWHNFDLNKERKMITESGDNTAYKSSWRGGPVAARNEKKTAKDSKDKGEKKKAKKKKDDSDDDNEDDEDNDDTSDDEDDESEGKGDRLEFWISADGSEEDHDYYIALQAGDFVWIVGHVSTPFVVCNLFSWAGDSSESISEADANTPDKVFRILEEKTLQYVFES